MADILMTGGGGGGVTSDDVTAKREDIVKGFKTIAADSYDEVVSGTLNDMDTETRALSLALKPDDNDNLFTVIPKGAYRKGPSGGNPYVYYPLLHYGTAEAYDTLEGRTATSKAGFYHAGKMPNRGFANHTLTNQGQAVSLSYGYYNGGTIQANISNLSPNNIRKGVSVGGVVGTLEDLGGSQSVFNLSSAPNFRGLMRVGGLSNIENNSRGYFADNSNPGLLPEGTLFINHDFRKELYISDNTSTSQTLGFISKMSIPMRKFNRLHVVLNTNRLEDYNRLESIEIELMYVKPGSRQFMGIAKGSITPAIGGWNTYHVDINTTSMNDDVCLGVGVTAIAKSFGTCRVNCQIQSVELHNN